MKFLVGSVPNLGDKLRKGLLVRISSRYNLREGDLIAVVDADDVKDLGTGSTTES
jgi:hypothetical protein